MSSDLDEWRREIAEQTEAERQTNCMHKRRERVCPDCGEKADDD